MATEDKTLATESKAPRTREHSFVEEIDRAFDRSIPMPTGIDKNAVEATLEDGMVEIHLPKLEAVERRTIERLEKRRHEPIMSGMNDETGSEPARLINAASHRAGGLDLGNLSSDTVAATQCGLSELETGRPDADGGLRRTPRRRGLHPEPEPWLRLSRDAGSGGEHARLAGWRPRPSRPRYGPAMPVDERQAAYR
jgi:hypothetical protein